MRAKSRTNPSQMARNIVRDDGVGSSNLPTPRPDRTDTLTDTSVLDRFWTKVQIGSRADCWPWKGAVAGSGYGSIRIGRKAVSAHRVAYWAKHGTPPAGLLIRHKCDNPTCVNPDHLEPGTHVDNMKDKKERGRQPPPREQAGEKNYNAKLTAADVALVREFIALGWTNKGLAKRFAVTQAAISAIRHGKSWPVSPAKEGSP